LYVGLFAGKHGGRTAKNGKARQAAGRARQSAVLKVDGGVTLNAAVKKTAELRRRQFFARRSYAAVQK
jgi:hypothetical protein